MAKGHLTRLLVALPGTPHELTISHDTRSDTFLLDCSTMPGRIYYGELPLRCRSLHQCKEMAANLRSETLNWHQVQECPTP